MSSSTARASAWSVTINNPIDADDENMALARQRGWRVDGQKEVGENGTPHYQLIVKTPQIRFSQLKKAFPRAHIEVCRNVAALETYVHKDATRESELAQTSDMYPSLQKFWGHLFDFTESQGWEYDGIVWSLRNRVLDADTGLELFDKFGGYMIRQGYCVETMLVNPQIRSIFKNFGSDILLRESRRQTDRQTDESSVSTI